MTSLVDSLSVVTPYGLSGSSCGYCEKSRGSRSYMMMGGGAPYTKLGLTMQDYKDLLDRGWRRSGALLYKPDMKNACCQQYTIRIDADAFTTVREHRQSLHKWSNFILGDEYIKESAKLRPISKEEKKKQRNSFDLLKTVHECEYEQTQQPPEPAHKLTVTLEPNDYTEEKYNLFKHYQETVHKDFRNSVDGFKRFLCVNPFKPQFEEEDGVKKYGAFHQCYRLDGKLVALGVIDLLPGCVSGVYFIYDESIAKFSPGKLSALRECALARERGYRWYYMGYYIHTCQKMRYKGAYQPAYLLDPENYGWHLLDKAFSKKLDDNPYVSMPLEGEDEEARKKKKSEEAGEGGGVASEAATESAAAAKSTEGKNTEDNGNVADDDDDDDDDEELEDWNYSSKTVFSVNMPGIVSLDKIEQELNLGRMMILVKNQLATADMLVGWDAMSARKDRSLANMLAEIAGTVGSELAQRIVVRL